MTARRLALARTVGPYSAGTLVARVPAADVDGLLAVVPWFGGSPVHVRRHDLVLRRPGGAPIALRPDSADGPEVAKREPRVPEPLLLAVANGRRSARLYAQPVDGGHNGAGSEPAASSAHGSPRGPRGVRIYASARALEEARRFGIPVVETAVERAICAGRVQRRLAGGPPIGPSEKFVFLGGGVVAVVRRDGFTPAGTPRKRVVRVFRTARRYPTTERRTRP